MLTRVVVENGLTGRESKECKFRATFAGETRAVGECCFGNELPFYAAQLACLLHKAVEANKKVEMQECRRWKLWV